jgi:hypothetical protein
MQFTKQHISSSQPTYEHAFVIELARPEAFYQPGDPIDGRVVVHPTTDEAQVDLRIELQAYVHGRVKAVAKILEAPLYQGPLRAGTSGAFPFRFVAPRRAPLYRGRLFTLETRLAVVAVGLASNRRGASLGLNALTQAYPAASQPVEVAPDLRPPVVSLDPASVTHARTHRQRMVTMGVAAIGLSLLLFALGASFHLIDLRDTEPFAWMLAGFGLVLAAIGVVILSRHLPARIAERRIGLPRVHVDERPGPAGPVVFVWVAIAAGARVHGMSAAIRVCERVESTAESSSGEERHALHEVAIALSPSGEPGVFHGSVPRSAFAGWPPAQAVPAVQIAWLLALHIDLPGYADWSAEMVLDAFPGGEKVPLPEQPLFSFD